MRAAIATRHHAYSDMQGLSPRNIKYMRSFAAARPNIAMVQGPLVQIGWYALRSPLKKTTSYPTGALQTQFAEWAKLEQALKANLRGLRYDA